MYSHKKENIKLIKTNTTLDACQKANKQWTQNHVRKSKYMTEYSKSLKAKIQYNNYNC